jgi:hypothetical protein
VTTRDPKVVEQGGGRHLKITSTNHVTRHAVNTTIRRKRVHRLQTNLARMGARILAAKRLLTKEVMQSAQRIRNHHLLTRQLPPRRLPIKEALLVIISHPVPTPRK